MIPDRKLDLLIGEKFFNLKVTDRLTREEKELTPEFIEELHQAAQLIKSVPYYSTDLMEAWELVKKLHTLDWDLSIETDHDFPDEVEVSIHQVYWDPVDYCEKIKGPFFFTEKTAARAICFAALKAAET